MANKLGFISGIVILFLMTVFTMGGMLGADSYKENKSLETTLSEFNNITFNVTERFESQFHEMNEENNDIVYLIGEAELFFFKFSFRFANIGIKVGYNYPEFNFYFWIRVFTIIVMIGILFPILPKLIAFVIIVIQIIQKLYKRIKENYNNKKTFEKFFKNKNG